MSDFRSLPSVNALAAIPTLERYPERVRIEAAQHALDRCRKAIENERMLDPEEEVVAVAERIAYRPLQRITNMSGTILHTGLGRAPTFDFLVDGYCNLEFDLQTGKRGDRQDHVRQLLCELTGAEDSFVVNNGAGAVLLTLSALCARKEVLLSRGQSIEIGGAFRMPDVIKASGCKLVDVGTTNKTYVTDYEIAISPKTVALLRCHPSNYEVKGFASETPIGDLAALAKQYGLLCINDQGNGSMIDFNQYGLHDVETLPQSVKSGADITIGSGDKLLGGPQCGIILGRKDLIAKIKKHPLARALRIDKHSLNLLVATLRHYRFGTHGELPIFRMLDFTPQMVREWCEAIAPEGSSIIETIAEIGSGSAPGQGVKSYAVALKSKNPDKLLSELRLKRVIGRIHRKEVLLDPRTCWENLVTQTQDGVLRLDQERANRFKANLTECWQKWK